MHDKDVSSMRYRSDHSRRTRAPHNLDGVFLPFVALHHPDHSQSSQVKYFIPRLSSNEWSNGEHSFPINSCSPSLHLWRDRGSRVGNEAAASATLVDASDPLAQRQGSTATSRSSSSPADPGSRPPAEVHVEVCQAFPLPSPSVKGALEKAWTVVS